jgi:hypothetical protein
MSLGKKAFVMVWVMVMLVSLVKVGERSIAIAYLYKMAINAQIQKIHREGGLGVNNAADSWRLHRWQNLHGTPRQQLRQVNALWNKHLDARAVIADHEHQLEVPGVFLQDFVACAQNGKTKLGINHGRAVTRFDNQNEAQDFGKFAHAVKDTSDKALQFSIKNRGRFSQGSNDSHRYLRGIEDEKKHPRNGSEGAWGNGPI